MAAEAAGETRGLSEEPMTSQEESVRSKQVVETAKKPSWSAVAQNKKALSKKDFSVSIIDGSPTVEIPDDVIDDSQPLWEDFVIGKFLSSAPHIAKVHVIVNKIWSLGNKAVKIDAYEVNEFTIKFRIPDKQLRARVIRRGMWNIAGIPMVATQWSPVIEKSTEETKIIPMWVVLKNVPHQMYSWEGLSFLASPVGHPKRLHPDTELCNNFEEAKVFVEIDVLKDLPKSYHFRSKKGIDATVEYKYPWLPVKCAGCSKWGHHLEACPEKKEIPITEVVSETRVVNYENQEKKDQEKSNEEVPQQKVLILNSDQATDQSATDPKDTWQTISPKKNAHVSMSEHEENRVLISPSRFSVLADEEEANEGDKAVVTEIIKKTGETEEVVEEEEKEKEEKEKQEEETEEGEISESESKDESSTDQGKMEEVVRPSLPRATKTQMRTNANLDAKSTKAHNQSATGKRGNRRKI
ncbi:hypothetical protein Bca4012_026572 [Brassica carinata]